MCSWVLRCSAHFGFAQDAVFFAHDLDLESRILPMPNVADATHAVVSTDLLPLPPSAPSRDENRAAPPGSLAACPNVPEPLGTLTEPQAMRRLADLFATLADTTRLRILEALAHGELCVGELAATLNLSQSATSHQLRILRDLRLVKPRRAGRSVFYSLADDCVYRLVTQGLAHIREQESL
jgi:DNA-binding transcriptional ArsR family regulator